MKIDCVKSSNRSTLSSRQPDAEGGLCRHDAQQYKLLAERANKRSPAGTIQFGSSFYLQQSRVESKEGGDLREPAVALALQVANVQGSTQCAV